MKTKTYLFEFFVHPGDAQKRRAIYIKAQTEGEAAMSEDGIGEAAAAIAAHDIPEMKPLDANPGRLLEITDEEPPMQYLRHKDHPGVVVWESNRGPSGNR